MKRKSLKFIFVSLIFSTIILSSCSDLPDNLLVIPENTRLVATLDMQSLATKADLKKVSEMQIFKALQQEIKNDNRELAGLLDELKENPLATGIDPRDDLAGFLYQISGEKMFVCVSASLSDADKFRETVKYLGESTGKDLHLYIEDKVTYVQLNYDTWLAWDDDKALLANATFAGETKKIKSEVLRLFHLEKNISDNTKFNDFLKNKKDFNLWLSYDLLYDLPQLKEQIGNQINTAALKDTYLHSYLSFEKGKISWTMDIIPGEAYKKIYDNNKLMFGSFNADLLRMTPAKQLLTISFAINLNEYFKILMQQPNMQEMFQAIETQSGISVSDLVESIRGNIILGMHDLKPVPQMSIAMELNNKEKISNLMETFPGVTKNGNLYTFDAGFTAVHLILEDKFCYLTNDYNLRQIISQGNYPDENLTTTTVGKNVNKYPAYMFFNLEKKDYPADVVAMAESNAKAALLIKMLDEYAVNMEVKSTGKFSGALEINTTNQSENSLYNLLSLINQYYQELVNL